MSRFPRYLLLSSAILLVGTTRSTAGVSEIGPFEGELTESFESFPNSCQAPLRSPISIMNGAATIFANVFLGVYEPDSCPYSLQCSGFAQTADGSKGFYHTTGKEDGPTTIIEFESPVRLFGGYWARETGGMPPPPKTEILFTFIAEDGALIDMVLIIYDHCDTSDGALEWHGWTSDIPIKKVIVFARIAIDALQATGTCLWDLDGSGDVGVSDFLELLGVWGPCPPKGDCPADFDNSGNVGVSDFLDLLGNWGPCP